ncbi:hypothetical protein GCM10022225_82060 [Plantactinospora mayteni]|uniref:Uncharacterized protein n=2 Tax=Plantactinospora mayteni TaxID=566021 RepID=A0ABQ4F410_9ACTN|nr:hypothetical protein Pma05_81870 [Plantactinospora mayteni]
MSAPDPNYMIKYCKEQLPALLADACEVDVDLAHQIGEDVLSRAEAFATLSTREQDVLIAPFVEEVFDHEPLDAPLHLRAKVTVVVRNSLLEQAHHAGPLASGIIAVTEYATGPLSHFLASRQREPIDYAGQNPFNGLAAQYPRAWACLSALTDVFMDGGRQALKLPAASMPQLPSGDEVAAEPGFTREGTTTATVFSAIDPRFDRWILDLLQQASDGDFVLCTSALSRYSRSSAKLHRVLEYLLAHSATILTTNYLIRPKDVWVRRGSLVKPNSEDPYAGLAQTRGLTGAHRKLAESVTAQLRVS